MLLQGATGELGRAVSGLLLCGVGCAATEASPGGSEPGSVSQPPALWGEGAESEPVPAASMG